MNNHEIDRLDQASGAAEDRRAEMQRIREENAAKIAALGEPKKRRLPTHGDRDQKLRTPRAFFNELQRRYGAFDLDLAADASNYLVSPWCGPGSTIHEDATHPEAVERIEAWRRGAHVRVFCNPPFSKIPAFLETCIRLAHRDATVVLLVPARTGTEWWHRLEHPEDGIVTQEDRILADWHAPKEKSGRLAYLDAEGKLKPSPFEYSTIWVLRKRLYAESFR